MYVSVMQGTAQGCRAGSPLVKANIGQRVIALTRAPSQLGNRTFISSHFMFTDIGVLDKCSKNLALNLIAKDFFFN